MCNESSLVTVSSNGFERWDAQHLSLYQDKFFILINIVVVAVIMLSEIFVGFEDSTPDSIADVTRWTASSSGRCEW